MLSWKMPAWTEIGKRGFTEQGLEKDAKTAQSGRREEPPRDMLFYGGSLPHCDYPPYFS